MWSTFSSTPLNAEEQAGLSVEFQIKERIDTTDDTTDDDTTDADTTDADTTPSQSSESLQTGEDEPEDVTREVPGTTGHIELRVSGFCAFRSLAVGLVYIYIYCFFSVCPRCHSHCSPQATCVFID